MVLQPVIGADHADQFFGAIVPGRDLVIGKRPVHAQPVAREGLEVVGPKRGEWRP